MACTITGTESRDELTEALAHHSVFRPADRPDWTAVHVDPLLDALAAA